jgi:hypothetical protein
LSQTRGVTSKKLGLGGQIRRIGAPIPAGLPPVLARFWDFTRKMAREFTKHLLKNREEDFLRAVRREFEKDQRGG